MKTKIVLLDFEKEINPFSPFMQEHVKTRNCLKFELPKDSIGPLQRSPNSFFDVYIMMTPVI